MAVIIVTDDYVNLIRENKVEAKQLISTTSNLTELESEILHVLVEERAKQRNRT